MRLDAEIGFLAPLEHTIQFGDDGTVFDYVADGTQNVLFPTMRFEAGLDVGKRETFTLLYQPLDLRTEVVLHDDVLVDTVTFAGGEPVDLRYGFSFWRATWLHEMLPAPQREFAVGLALQLRDANISFTSGDGTKAFVEHDVGPVPALVLRLRLPVGKTGFFGAEATGIYAPIKYLNGSNVDVVGALLDASVRAGLAMPHGTDLFLCARYIGGGAEGTVKNSEAFGDGYTANWPLHDALVGREPALMSTVEPARQPKSLHLVRDRWYVILESHEVPEGRTLGVTRLGVPLVLWRDSRGVLRCASDRCPHRGAALSLGRVVDGHVECPFHGFRFDGTGVCTRIPAHGAAGRIPSAMRTTGWEVREANGFAWLWYGETPSGGVAALPDVPWFPEVDAHYACASFADDWDTTTRARSRISLTSRTCRLCMRRASARGFPSAWTC